MRRHGMTPSDLWPTSAIAHERARFEGVTMHFGLDGGSLAEVRAQMDAVVGAEATTVWVSHLSANELASCARPTATSSSVPGSAPACGSVTAARSP